MSSKKTYQRNPDHPWQSIANQTIILNTDGMMSFELEDVGQDIWTWLDAPMTLEQLSLRLEETYDVSAEAARKDVSDFLTLMESEGLIQCQL